MMYPSQQPPQQQPKSSMWVIWLVFGLVVFVMLIAAVTGALFFAVSRQRAKAIAMASSSTEQSMLLDARMRCTMDDCEASHATVLALPEDSPLRTSDDARTIESTWATSILNRARVETDPSAKALMLMRVQNTPTVPEPQRADATAMLAGDGPNGPMAPWGRGDALGLGDALDAGALGLGGFGSNGGTTGGSPPGSQHTRAPSIRQGATQVNGRLPPEVIQRIVRQNFGRFRLCYENGLRSNPSLQGRVAVKFVVDRSGAVQSAQDGGSDLPDKDVIACVVRGFGNLSFPQPEGGIVTVVYPMIFSPGD